MLCHSYTYVMLFIIRFSNSNKLCIALRSGTQTKIRGAHLLRGVRCSVAQTNSDIWSSRKLTPFNHTQYWDAANNTVARSRIYCPGQMMAVNNRHRFQFPWFSAFSNRKILSESTDKCWKVRARFYLFLNVEDLSSKTHFNNDTKWRWVVSFTPRPLYPRRKIPRYSYNTRLRGPQSLFGYFGEDKSWNNSRIEEIVYISIVWEMKSRKIE